MRLSEEQSRALSRATSWTTGEEFVNALRPLTFHQFVELYRLRFKHDECGESIVRGKFGHLYEHDAGWFGVVLEAPADGKRLDSTLRSRKRRAIAAGFVLHQEGDSEAILLFDSADPKQAGLAIRLIHAKKIRQAARPTDAQLRARALFSSKVRSRRPCFDQKAKAIVELEGNTDRGHFSGESADGQNPERGTPILELPDA